MLASGLAGACALLPLLPALARAAPACPLHALLGVPCPGCGTTRALLALARGDVVGALAWNPLAGLAGALGAVTCALAPLWVAVGGPVPALDAVLPARTRVALVTALALNWAYLAWRGV